MSRLSGKYTAQELLTLELKGGTPLIEGLLWEQDTVVLVGKEKSGKSIFGLQLACALTSAHPFLGQFEVPKSVPVAMIQAEGKLYNTKSNLERMTRVIPCDQTKLCFFYYPSIALDHPADVEYLIQQIDSWQRPEVIILDPLYMAMAGDLIDNQDARRMVANLRELAERYQATFIIIHHTHRAVFDRASGRVVEEGDDSIFGSFVWKAYPDNVFLLQKRTGKTRQFVGDTQRMDKTPTEMKLTLIGSGVEQDALYFALETQERSTPTVLLEHIPLQNSQQGITSAELVKLKGLSRMTTWRYLNDLKSRGLVGSPDLQAHPQVWYRVSPDGIIH